MCYILELAQVLNQRVVFPERRFKSLGVCMSHMDKTPSVFICFLEHMQINRSVYTECAALKNLNNADAIVLTLERPVWIGLIGSRVFIICLINYHYFFFRKIANTRKQRCSLDFISKCEYTHCVVLLGIVPPQGCEVILIRFVLNIKEISYIEYSIQTGVSLNRGLCIQKSHPLSKHAFIKIVCISQINIGGLKMLHNVICWCRTSRKSLFYTKTSRSCSYSTVIWFLNEYVDCLNVWKTI